VKPSIKQRGKKLTEKRLAQLEKKLGIRLPDSYRAFLLEYNGGTPEPNGLCRKRKKNPTEVCHYFLQVDSGRDHDDWSRLFEQMKDKEAPVLPLRLAPIATDPFGNFFCISVSGKDAGKIYFWHHEESFIPDPPRKVVPDDSGISLMADSFDDFLNQFAENEADKKSRRQAPGWEALIEARDVKGVREWLDQGGYVNEPNGRGETPLHLAVEADEYPIVELFLTRGVNADTALGVIIERKRWSLARKLLKREKSKKFQITPTMFADTLHECDDVEVIRALLDAGAPIHGEHYGNNALHSATLFKGKPQIVRLLLERGAKLKQSSDSRDALANCICQGYLEAAKLLLDAGASLYADPKKKTKLQIRLEKEMKEEQSKAKPNQFILEMHKHTLEHESKVNAPKAPIHYFDYIEKTRIPKSFKKDVIEYAAKLGQKPAPEKSSKST
jgi:ankyrin repeat protein